LQSGHPLHPTGSVTLRKTGTLSQRQITTCPEAGKGTKGEGTNVLFRRELSGTSILFYPEDGGSRSLRNVHNALPDCMVSYPGIFMKQFSYHNLLQLKRQTTFHSMELAKSLKSLRKILKLKLHGLSPRANYTEQPPIVGEVIANFCG
jgi:hypothetical protein